MAAIATFALKPGVWFRRVRLVIVSPDSQRTACLLSGRNSTYRPVQISGTSSGARIYGLFGTVWALMQFVFSPVQGALSDRFGRRPVILISNFGLGLDYIVMALAPSLNWLFVGRVISGITAASISTSYAYVADVTPAEARAARFGLLGAAFGIGFVLGPALGRLAGAVDPRLPFWIAAGPRPANTPSRPVGRNAAPP